MKSIDTVLKQPQQSIEELLHCFEIVKSEGNVAVIKLDGGRVEKQYTIFISFPGGDRDMIRKDGDDIKATLLEVIRCYQAGK